MFCQQVFAPVTVEITPYAVNVIGIVLRVVVLDQKRADACIERGLPMANRRLSAHRMTAQRNGFRYRDPALPQRIPQRLRRMLQGVQHHVIGQRAMKQRMRRK